MRTDDPRRAESNALARKFADKGEFADWFDALYAEAGGDFSRIPWANLAPNPNLVEWLDRNDFPWGGKTAVCVGCGLGDDAEELARRGFLVTAFDISPNAIDTCRARFPDSLADYLAADLFTFHRPFDFVFESYTVQALPVELREPAIAAVARLVAPGGSLLVICRGRDDGDPPGTMPWPLTRAEIRLFESRGLVEMAFEDFMDPAEPEVRRFRALFARPSLAA